MVTNNGCSTSYLPHELLCSTIDDEVRDVRHNAALLAGQIEGLASKIEDLQTAEAVSIGRAARAAQATELHMQEATEAIGGQLKVQLETSMADERRCEFKAVKYTNIFYAMTSNHSHSDWIPAEYD